MLPSNTNTDIKTNTKTPLPPTFHETEPSHDSDTNESNEMTFPLKDSPQRAKSQSSQQLKAPTSTLQRQRQKVILEPGHSALDWARLQTKSFHGLPTFLKITPAMLKEHNKKADDKWTSIQGKVYNINHYLPFHPGGKNMLLSVAGRDGTEFFMKYHSWVNIDHLMNKCMVGILIPDRS